MLEHIILSALKLHVTIFNTFFLNQEHHNHNKNFACIRAQSTCQMSKLCRRIYNPKWEIFTKK